ncbi:MAG: hypothetical protein ACI3W8_08205 [Oscillospiraceae bacterium]
MKTSMIHVLFAMVALVTLAGIIAVSAVGQYHTLALVISFVTVLIACVLCNDAGRLRESDN